MVVDGEVVMSPRKRDPLRCFSAIVVPPPPPAVGAMEGEEGVEEEGKLVLADDELLVIVRFAEIHMFKVVESVGLIKCQLQRKEYRARRQKEEREMVARDKKHDHNGKTYSLFSLQYSYRIMYIPPSLLSFTSPSPLWCLYLRHNRSCITLLLATHQTPLPPPP